MVAAILFIVGLVIGFGLGLLCGFFVGVGATKRIIEAFVGQMAERLGSGRRAADNAPFDHRLPDLVKRTFFAPGVISKAAGNVPGRAA